MGDNAGEGEQIIPKRKKQHQENVMYLINLNIFRYAEPILEGGRGREKKLKQTSKQGSTI